MAAMSLFEKLIKTPNLDRDEFESHRVKLLNVILLAGGLLVVFVILGNLFDPATPLRNYLIDIFILMLTLLLRRELLKGKVKFVGIGLTFAVFMVSTAALLNEGNILTPSTTSFLLLVIITGILFDGKAILLAIVSSSLVIAGVMLAHDAGLLLVPGHRVAWIHWFVFTVMIGITGGLTYFVQLVTLQALERSIKEIRERELAEVELRKLSRVVEQSPASVVITDLNGNIEYVNPRFTCDTGYVPEEVVGQNPRVFESGQTPPETYQKMWETLQAGQEWRGEFVKRKKDGSIYCNFTVISGIMDGNGVLINYLALEEDITERKQFVDALRASEARFRSLFEQTHDAVFLLDLKGNYMAVNQHAAEMLGYSAEELVGNPGMMLSAEQEKSRQVLERLLAGEVIPHYERQLRRRDGQKLTVDVLAELIRDRDGSPTHIQSVVRDISQRKQAEENLKVVNTSLNLKIVQVEKLQFELLEQALHDPLTGLYNRRFMGDALVREIQLAEREEGVISLIVMDIDHFKQVNDLHGHFFGDQVLIQISEMLKRFTRGSDFCCRFGGEEFLLVMPGATSEVAVQRANEIRRHCLDLAFEVNGHVQQPVSMSFGIASYPQHGKDPEELLMHADKAMYQSKSAGRNRVSIYEE